MVFTSLKVHEKWNLRKLNKKLYDLLKPTDLLRCDNASKREDCNNQICMYRSFDMRCRFKETILIHFRYMEDMFGYSHGIYLFEST